MVHGYQTRAWLHNYPARVPPDLPLPDQSAVDLFERTAATHPNRPALLYFDQPISYAALDSMVDAFAVALQALGVGRGDRVASFLQHVPQFVIAHNTLR
jgi:acyl-CoA synthetase (AMP-forming)/AMP-acid ligase II